MSIQLIIKEYNESIVDVVDKFKERKPINDYIEILQLSAELTIRLLTGAELIIDEDDDGGEIRGGIESKECVTIGYSGENIMHININNNILARITRMHNEWSYEHKSNGKEIFYDNCDGTHYQFIDEYLTITVDR